VCADLHIITYLNLTTSYTAVKHGDMLSGDSVTLKRHDLNVDQMLQLMASSCYGASLLSITNVGEGTTRQSRSITIVPADVKAIRAGAMRRNKNDRRMSSFDLCNVMYPQ